MSVPTAQFLLTLGRAHTWVILKLAPIDKAVRDSADIWVHSPLEFQRYKVLRRLTAIPCLGNSGSLKDVSP